MGRFVKDEIFQGKKRIYISACDQVVRVKDLAGEHPIEIEPIN